MAIGEALIGMGELLSRCESPTEELLLLALDTVLRANKIRPVYLVPESNLFSESFTLADAADEFEDDVFDIIVTVEPQAAVIAPDHPNTEFRADFLVNSYRWDEFDPNPITQFHLAVEVDGRHHATDSRRSRDNERDRVFRSLGITTDRYTGVDINRDPYACAARIMKQF